MKRVIVILYIVSCLLPLCVCRAQCFGKVYPQRLDDLTWENEYCAWRAYGPALQRKGERSYGYDIWVKNTSDTVVNQRYRLHFPPYGASGKKKSFHKDWGNGMDCYAVGASLGGGTAALLDNDGKLIYPWCWKECEIMSNSPDSFKVHLVYPPMKAGEDNVIEHRVITAKSGERFNRCEVWYEGLNHEREIAAGIVVHKENTDTLLLDSKRGIIAYVDLQDPKMVAGDGSDGVIYIGVICPAATKTRYEQGHLLAIGTIKPDERYTYYFGATWSKRDVHSFRQWRKLLEKINKF